jgi:hypothetical protein
MGDSFGVGYKKSDESIFGSYIHWDTNTQERITKYLAIHGLKKFTNQIDKHIAGGSSIEDEKFFIESDELFSNPYTIKQFQHLKDPQKFFNKARLTEIDKYEKTFIVNSMKTITIYSDYGRQKKLHKMKIIETRREIINNIFNGEK